MNVNADIISASTNRFGTARPKVIVISQIFKRKEKIKKSTKIAVYNSLTSTKIQVAMSAIIYLNIYDTTSLNNILDCFNLGAYHTGLQIDDTEYMFGAHEEYETGVYSCKPKQSRFTLRRTVLMGNCSIDEEAISEVINDLMIDYIGKSYDIFKRNCNHFTNELCLKLLNKPIPQFIFYLPNCFAWTRCMFTKKFIKGGFDKDHPKMHKDSLFLGKKRITSRHNTQCTNINGCNNNGEDIKQYDKQDLEMGLMHSNKDLNCSS